MFSYPEKRAFQNGCQVIAGVDEAGRGPLAGPVAAAAVSIKKGTQIRIKGVRDSKQLTAKQREEIFEKIINQPEIDWKVSFVLPKTIDKKNILQATFLAWRSCLKKLNFQPDFLFVDGNMNLPGVKIEQKSVIKGDQKIFVLSLASIVAKVSRDRLMERLDKKYPEYGFSQHKGYGTKLHLARLKKFGPAEIHRRSFRPIRGMN